MSQGVQLAKTTLLFSSTKDAYLLVQMDIIIIHQAKFANNVIALAVLVLEEQIQTVSHVVLLLISFSLNIDVWQHARMDSCKMLQTFVINAQNLLLRDANLAIRHARHVLHFKYP